MNHLLDVHSKFFKEVVVASKIDAASKVSAIPTILFLSSTFLLLYGYFHKLTSNYGSPKATLCRECGFHFAFFYVTRIWFLLLKGGKQFIKFADEYFKLSQVLNGDCLFCLNPDFASGIVFSILLIISSAPVMILFVKWFHKHHIPNFLMWVAEDPWLRSEIGMSGHYLERPPPFVFPTKPKKRRYHQGLRRSTSADYVMMRRSAVIIRPSKSWQYPRGSSNSF